jgi:hypothetical protein
VTQNPRDLIHDQMLLITELFRGAVPNKTPQEQMALYRALKDSAHDDAVYMLSMLETGTLRAAQAEQLVEFYQDGYIEGVWAGYRARHLVQGKETDKKENVTTNEMTPEELKMPELTPEETHQIMEAAKVITDAIEDGRLTLGTISLELELKLEWLMALLTSMIPSREPILRTRPELRRGPELRR